MVKHQHFIKLLSLGLCLVGAVIVILEFTHNTNIFHKAAVVRAPSESISRLPSSANSNDSASNKVPSSTPTLNQGSPTDQNGQVPSNVPTNQSKWSVSASGVITVKLPGADSTIQPGATVTGTASVSQVQYRLTDNKVGVVSQGPINVVNGNFTASINFKAYGNGGRLDVFTTDSVGRESNEVQIPVNF